jgi:glutathione S-transferase
MFAAVSTMEPPIVEREQVGYGERDRPWYEERLPILDDRIRVRLDELSHALGDADWLDGRFSAGDLMMVMVLRRVATRLLEEYPGIAAYVARGEARPAFKRAYAAQKAVAEAASRRK